MNLPPQVKFIQRGWFNSNHVLITGKHGSVLIDTGHQADVAETVRLIKAGVHPTDLRLIVNTHCHWDHHGGNAALQAMSGALVATSAATANIFARNDQRAMWLDYFGEEAATVTPDITWQDGDEVILGDLPFVVIASPGHAPDAISLYQPDYRLLVCADALLERDCGIINVAVHGDATLEAALTTVERFRQLEITVALPGHGNLICDVPDSLEAVYRRLQRFQREPAQLALHLARRVLMTYLIGLQPVERDVLIASAAGRPWAEDYGPRCGYSDVLSFIGDLIDDFIRRDLIQVQSGRLVSLVPR